MKIVNLTPHTLTIVREDLKGPHVGYIDDYYGTQKILYRFSVVAQIKPSGIVARALRKEREIGRLRINGCYVPIVSSEYGEPINLPNPKEGTLYAVSLLTAQAAKLIGRDTNDLLVVSASESVRDSAGNIIGCLKFTLI